MENKEIFEEATNPKAEGLDEEMPKEEKKAEKAEAKEQKKIVNVWTVNKEEIMREMIALGVDYITTDEPVLLQQVLKGKK